MGEFADDAIYDEYGYWLTDEEYNNWEEGPFYPIRTKTNCKVGDVCPICKKGTIVERINRTTKQNFLGCSMFPKCKGY